MCCWLLGVPAVCVAAYYIWNRFESQKRVEGIHKKCVFITGCDSGFGNALARRLDVLGVPVFAGCLTGKGATELKENASERMRTIIVDVGVHDSISKAFESVRNNIPEGAELWGIVNNAGVGGEGGPIEFMTRKAFSDTFEVNLFGPVDVTLAFLPLLKKSEGRIVNTSSASAMSTFPGMYPYLTSKHAMRAFSGAIRLEKEAYGIKVSTVLPGMFSTPIIDVESYRSKVDQQWNDLPQEVRDEFGEEYHNQVTAGVHSVLKAAPPDVSPVVNAYEHALFAQKPQDEYFPGKDSAFISYIVMLPKGVVEYLFKKVVMGGGKGGPRPKFLMDKEKKRNEQ